jgi:transposase
MDIQVKRVDHWGIVAGLMKDIKLSNLVDSQIGTDSQEILTTGEVVMGLVINGLGFASRPLMLAPQFFENKALDILIKKGVRPEHFNRHKIGRVLDDIAKFGCENCLILLLYLHVNRKKLI